MGGPGAQSAKVADLTEECAERMVVMGAGEFGRLAHHGGRA